MKNYHKNPRIITERQFASLKEWLRELGDLSGVVHDLETDEIIGGNQRSRVFNINQCEIQIVARFDPPDEQGTVAHGFVLWEGKRYAYRAVRWSREQAEKANIIANAAGGSWDWNILANRFETENLLSWGFSEQQLQIPGYTASASAPKSHEKPARLVDAVVCPACGHHFAPGE